MNPAPLNPVGACLCPRGGQTHPSLGGDLEQSRIRPRGNILSLLRRSNSKVLWPLKVRREQLLQRRVLWALGAPWGCAVAKGSWRWNGECPSVRRVVLSPEVIAFSPLLTRAANTGAPLSSQVAAERHGRWAAGHTVPPRA